METELHNFLARVEKSGQLSSYLFNVKMILLVPFIYIYNADQEVLPSFKRHELKKNLNYLSVPYLIFSPGILVRCKQFHRIENRFKIFLRINKLD